VELRERFHQIVEEGGKIHIAQVLQTVELVVDQGDGVDAPLPAQEFVLHRTFIQACGL
jgi:hypothetical protein